MIEAIWNLTVWSLILNQSAIAFVGQTFSEKFQYLEFPMGERLFEGAVVGAAVNRDKMTRQETVDDDIGVEARATGFGHRVELADDLDESCLESQRRRSRALAGPTRIARIHRAGRSPMAPGRSTTVLPRSIFRVA